MQNYEYLIYAITGAVLALAVLVMLLAFLNRRRLERKPQLPEDLRQTLQADLLDWIVDRSANQTEVVDIREFWRGRAVCRRQRLSVVIPLVRDHHVTVHSEPGGAPLLELSKDLFRYALCLPPTALVLTDRTWLRMAYDGVSGRNVIIGDVHTFNWQSAGGDIVGSPQLHAGRDAQVHTRDTASRSYNPGTSPEQLQELATALRADALRLTSPAMANRVHVLADEVDEEADSERVDSETVGNLLTRANRCVERTGQIMLTTSKLLGAWRDLRTG